MVAPFTGPFPSTHNFRYATSFKWYSSGRIVMFVICNTYNNLFLDMWALKELAQRKMCVEGNRSVNGATMSFQKFLIKQPYGDN